MNWNWNWIIQGFVFKWTNRFDWFGMKVLHLLVSDKYVSINVQNRTLAVNQAVASVGNKQLESDWCHLLRAHHHNVEDDNILVVSLDAYDLQLQVGPGTNILIKVILNNFSIIVAARSFDIHNKYTFSNHTKEIILRRKWSTKTDQTDFFCV